MSNPKELEAEWLAAWIAAADAEVTPDYEDAYSAACDAETAATYKKELERC